MEKTWNKQLKDWIYQNKKTIKEVSKETGINYSTLKHYRSGDTKDIDSISPENRRILFHYTGLNIFKTETMETEFDLMKNLNELTREVKNLRKNVAIQLPYDKKLKILRSGYQPSINERIENVTDIIYLLIDELDYFKGSSEQRKRLTESLNSEDVGYLVSFLNNIFKTDKTIGWFFKNTIAPKRPKG